MGVSVKGGRWVYLASFLNQCPGRDLSQSDGNFASGGSLWVGVGHGVCALWERHRDHQVGGMTLRRREWYDPGTLQRRESGPYLAVLDEAAMWKQAASSEALSRSERHWPAVAPLIGGEKTVGGAGPSYSPRRAPCPAPEDRSRNGITLNAVHIACRQSFWTQRIRRS